MKLWTPEEIKFVRRNLNRRPYKEFVRAFRLRWPERSPSAIRNYLRHNNYKRHPAFAIRCIETGKVWKDSVEASRELFVSSTHINKCILAKKKVASINMTFERVAWPLS